jgi:hypothetical protein
VNLAKEMSRLTAEQIRNLSILSKESSGDDSCDESEIDIIEADLRTASESEDEGNDDDEVIEKDFSEILTVTSTSSLAFTLTPTAEATNHSEILFHRPIEQNNTNSGLSKSHTFDVIHDDNYPNNIIFGRANKVQKTPFEWYERPNKRFLRYTNKHSCVIPQLKDEKSIEFFFKMIIPNQMVDKIILYTNKKIALVDNIGFENIPITPEELYAYIGVLILLGITKKSDVSVESLWCSESLHYAPIAVATMARHRFQLISRFLTFDDLDTRTNRSNHKFYKMSEIFNDFKDNLALIQPSYSLCVDEELYAFRGF